MNLQGVLVRVYERINKDTVIKIIQDRDKQWSPSKKSIRKKDLRDDFLALEKFIKPEEIEDFVEMAVMSKSIGLPAYTYKLKDIDFLRNENDESQIDVSDISDHPFQNKYSITVENKIDDIKFITFTIRLKEYSELWKTGVKSLDRLSAVYKVNITLDKEKKIVTIFTGNHDVQRTISDFLINIIKWPLQNYRIRELANQSWEIGNASFKTALLLDFVSNRLTEKGIFCKFKEIKFNTNKNSKHKKEGIRNITINGRNLLSSQLACEYVTLGSDILSFKVDISFDDQDYSSLFYLKGSDLDILKIVVIGLEEDDNQQRIIDLIQEEYIEMCNNGISNLDETKRLLEQIYERFIHGDKLTNEVIQESTIQIVDSFVSVLDNVDTENEDIIKIIEDFYVENKIILDAIGYDESNTNLQRLKEMAEINEFDDYDEFGEMESENK